MEPLLASISRRLLRPPRDLKGILYKAPVHSTYTTSSACQTCRTQTSRLKPPTAPPRRWISQTATASTPSSASPAPPSATSTHEAQPQSYNPLPKTHYSLFPQTLPLGPPPSGPFIVNARQLRQEYLQLQAIAHPDRHVLGMKAGAEATSARINEAYKTLRDPLLRTQYLLSLRGIDVAGDEAGKVGDIELLKDVFDAWEVIEGAEVEGDLVELRELNEGRISRSEALLERAFGDDNLGRAGEEAVRLRYWVNIRESLDAWERGEEVELRY